MELARGGSGDDAGWLWALGALALYVLISYGLRYRARVRRGSVRPAREALHDLEDREDPPPRQRFVSRVIMLCGGAATGLAAFATSGAVRVVAVGLTLVVGVAVWAYHDHRAEARAAADPADR
ncbi:hypothetical protein [Streptomyces sp. MB09-02B]|uniref:hypothetical protein n=1 Tax=Streptomyces sp. MB09-02B TaxID=3028667 RepID=UPI0029A26E03|nr:hypothetical protein [Streptomyces sp. MB09-02B]MDX3643004.1 hypothetical protein [Streptomyces sp. MB09-02B]